MTVFQFSRRRYFFLTSILSVVVIALYEYYSYRAEYIALLRDTDSHLRTASTAVNYIVGEYYHDQRFDKDSISTEEYTRTALKLTDFAGSAGLEYVYTMVLDDEGNIRFVSSSLTPEKLAAGELENYYWVEYTEADRAIFETFTTGRPHYAEYADRWGNYRSLFNAHKNAQGITYVIGVDQNLSEFKELKKHALLKAASDLVVVLSIICFWFLSLRSHTKRLNDSNRRFNLAISVGSSGIWEWHIAKNQLYVTPIFFNSLGFPDDQIPQDYKAMSSLVHPDDLKTYLHHREIVVHAPPFDPAIDEYQMRMRSYSGDYVWMHVKGETISWLKDGKPRMRAGVIENIDGIKNLQLKLQQSERELSTRESFLSSLLNNLPDLVTLKDAEGQYLLCNTPFEKVFGVNQKDIIGKSDFDFLPLHVAEILRKNDDQALNSDHSITVREWLVYASDDHSRLVETVKTRLYNAQTQTYCVLSLGRDITETNRVMEELEKFHRFAQFSGQGLAIANLNGQLTYTNPMFNTLVAAPESGLPEQGVSLQSFYTESSVTTLNEHVLPETHAQGRWHGELSMRGADGNGISTLQTFFTVLSEHGTPLFLGIIVTDISELKRISSELESAKEEAEFANKSKSMFLANMSHEIRTPLNAIIGYAQLLAHDNSLRGEKHNQIEHIYNSGNHLLSLINDILDLSKMEAGKSRLTLTHFDLRAELNNIAGMMEQRATSKDIVLVKDIALPSPAVVTSDRQKLAQIVVNLLSNAIKFTDEGEVRLHCETHEDEVTIAVIDTGEGISEEEQKHLFTPFVQGTQGERVGSGTGLGLILAKSFTEHLGGALQLDSQPGKGTCITLRLPLQVHSDDSVVTHADIKLTARLAPDQRCQVLVVDDDENSRKVLSQLLNLLGFQVRAVDSGKAALRQLEDDDFAAVFTDIRMPEMDGVALLTKLRDSAWKDKPVLAVSASSMEHERSYFIGRGFNDFISKPVELGELLRAAHSHIDAEWVTAGDEFADQAQAPDTALPTRITEDDIAQLNRIREAALDGNVDKVFELLNALSGTLQQSTAFKSIHGATSGYDMDAVERLVSELLATTAIET